MPKVSRHFLGWGQPFLESVVDRLWPQREQFGESLLIVPTSESGRKLREKLTEKGAYFSPQCITPAQFVSQVLPNLSSLLERGLWEECLLSIEPRDWTGILPQVQTKQWQRGVAGQVIEARQTLLQVELDFTSVFKRLSPDHPDLHRYQFLSSLEGGYRERLKKFGCSEPLEILGAASYQFSFSEKRILLLGVSDPSELFQKLLLQASEQYDVEAWVYANEEFSAGFSGLGFPEPDFWADQKNNLLSNEQILLANDFAAMAHQVVEEISSQPEVSAIGGVTSAMLPYLELELKRSNRILHNPEGERLSEWTFLKWLQTFCDWTETKELSHLASLLQSQWTECLLTSQLELSRYEVLSNLHILIDRFIVRTDTDLWSIAKTKEELGLRPKELFALSSCLDFLKKLNEAGIILRKSKKSFEALGSFLALCLKDQESDQIQALTEVFHSLKEEVEGLPKGVILQQSYLDLFLEACGRSAVVAPKTNTDLDASGWLELGYETAPHLKICGVNEGVIPKGEGFNPWLSRPLKEELGLKGDKERFGHDAYYLRALCESRKQNGSVKVFVPGFGDDGSPLQPSRLLLKTDSTAKRALHVFSENRFALSTPAWVRDWQYEVQLKEEPLSKISTTAFTDYLVCPFRYYLKHILKMQRPDRKKTEWNARDYGNILHQVLENMSRDEEASLFTEKKALTDWLLSELDKVLVIDEGRELSLVTQIQRDSMQQRLSFFAEKEVTARENIHYGHRTLKIEDPFQFSIDEVLVKGTIDRVDSSAEGDVRLIDYKTGTAKDPFKAHLKKIIQSTKVPKHLEGSPAIFDLEGQPHLWTNLQLPLYAYSHYKQSHQVPEIAYCNLAPSLADTGYLYWEMPEEVMNAAVNCAEFIIAQIKEHKFSPIIEQSASAYDDFREFSFGYSVGNAFALSQS